MTYRENVNYLLQRERINTNQIRANTNEQISNIRNAEKTAIDNIQKAEGLLVGTDPSASFARGKAGMGNAGQGLIPWQFGRYVKKEEAKGTQAAIDDRKDQLARIAKLQNHLELVQSQDTQMHEMKYNMLLNGAYYEDADRFTKLSPHAQVAYAQHKLNLYSETIEDKLSYYMAKSEDALDVNGVGYTPKSVTGIPLAPLALKEHALNVGLDKIRTQHGINGFSAEMLELAGVTGTEGSEQKAKEALLGKYRNQYTIQASHDTRLREFMNFINNDTYDLNRLLTVYKGTYDESLGLLNYKGAWEEFETIAVDALVRGDITEEQLYAAFDVVNYDPAHKGKKFIQSHDHRYESIIRQAKDKRKEILEKEIELSKLDATEIKAQFEKDTNGGNELLTRLRREGKLRDEHLEVYYTAWKNAGGANDGNMPTWLTDIYTVQEQDQDKIYNDAKNTLSARKYLTAYDIRNATPETLNKLRQLPNFQMSSQYAQESVKQFEKGPGGYERGITTAIKEALGLSGDDELPGNWTALYNNTFAGYQTAYHDYLTKHQLPPNQAHAAALQHIRTNWGLPVAGEASKITSEESPYRKEPVYIKPDKSTPIGDRVVDQANKISKLYQKTGDFTFLKKVSIIEPDSEDHKMLIEYRDRGGSGPIPTILTGVNRHFREFTIEDLINAQLIALEGPDGGLKSYSAVDQSLKVEGLQELRDRLLYKPTSSSKVTAKLDAIDGESNFPVDQTVDGEVTNEEDQAQTVDELYEDEFPVKEPPPKKEEDKTFKDFEDEAREQLGPAPVKPKKEDFIVYTTEYGQERDGKAESIQYMAAMGEYNKAIEKYNSDLQALMPSREPESRIVHTLGKNRVEVLMNGEWVEMSKEQHESLRNTIKTLSPNKPFDYSKYKITLNEQGGFDIDPIEVEEQQTETVEPNQTPTLDNKISYLQSIYNLPGSPVLSPLQQGYAGELIAMNLADNYSPVTFDEAMQLDATQGNNYNTWDYIVAKAKAAGAKYPELVAAQFMLESGRGESFSGVNNYFNLQTTENDDHTLMDTEEWRGDGYTVEPAYFKNFESVDQSINYLVRLWYQDFSGYKGVNNAKTITAAAKQLQNEGYATEPEYAKRLMELIREFKKRPAKAELAMA